MKTNRPLKFYGWVIGILFIIILSSCRSTPPKQEPVTSPPPSTPSESPPPPQKATSPSPQTGKPGPLPKVEESLPSEKPPPEETYFTHTVKWSGETVSIIAGWYTGDIENWKILAEVMLKNNPNADVKRIFIGDKILIPESMMKTRDPMPKEFVDSFYKRSKPEKGSTKKPGASPSGEEEPQLFGPKELPKR